MNEHEIGMGSSSAHSIFSDYHNQAITFFYSVQYALSGHWVQHLEDNENILEKCIKS